jgi:hypothetical protein
MKKLPLTPAREKNQPPKAGPKLAKESADGFAFRRPRGERKISPNS